MELLHSGKVRDVWEDGDDLLLVASDRISVFDVVLPTPIPDKGAVLTQLSLKFAGKATGGFDFSAHAFALAIASGWLWIALACYCGTFLVWMLILGHSNLSRAFPTTAIVFVAVMLASWLVLHEPIGGVQIIGAAVIVAGILQLGSDAPTAARTSNLTTPTITE